MTAVRRSAAAVVAVVLAAGGLALAADRSASPATEGATTVTGASLRVSPGCVSPGWVSVWSMPTSDATGLPVPAGSTLREVVYPHLGGDRVRVHLSNRLDAAPEVVSAVTIGVRSTGAAVVPQTMTPLLFDGAPGVTIPPGGEVTSDPADFVFGNLQDLSVSLYLAQGAATPAEHQLADEADYGATSGDRSADPSADGFTRTPSSGDSRSPFSSTAILSGVDAYAGSTLGAVVALGDSLTDGLLVHGDAAEARWPDVLARRLAAAGAPLSVANAGISGNLVTETLTGHPYGPSALERYDADVGAQADVRTVILFEGINDIHHHVPVGTIEAADSTLVTRAHAAGLRILLATVTPAGVAGSSAATAAYTAQRLLLNDWIRSQRLADGVVDFDKVVADPRRPGQLAARYDGGDHLHLDPAGYAALADAVPLPMLLPAGCLRPEGQ